MKYFVALSSQLLTSKHAVSRNHCKIHFVGSFALMVFT